MINRLLSRFHLFRDRYLLRLPPRAENPYLTHVPVLMEVGRWRQVRRVLELGCGEFSTKLFLNPKHYPHLQYLRSVENDPSWADRIRQQCQPDARLDLRLVRTSIAEEVAALGPAELSSYDLIFIDDSSTAQERCDTIRAVAASRPEHAVVIIHDFEYRPYRQAAGLFANQHRITGVNPNVGIVWNETHLAIQPIRALNRKLRQAAS